VRVAVLLFQPGEQVPQVPLLGVGAALPMGCLVVVEEAVEHRRVAGGEILLDVFAGHPRAERPAATLYAMIVSSW
jgi:hypothetical protein